MPSQGPLSGPVYRNSNMGLFDPKTDLQPQRCNISPAKTARVKRTMPDRFIPSRVRPQSSSVEDSKGLSAAFGVAHSGQNTRVLEFQRPAPQLTNPLDLSKPYAGPALGAQLYRSLSQTPERVLDAPGIRDDFYLNVLSWSRGNQLAIALDRSVYVYDANTLFSSHLYDFSSYVSCLKHNRGHHLATGLEEGNITIFDTNTGQKLRTMRKHLTGPDRILSLAWNGNILSSGSESGKLWQHDVRIAEHNTTLLRSHMDSVCALAYQAEGGALASSSRDQTVQIWDIRATTPRLTIYAHTSAVKALAWSPSQPNVLATGGGSNDRTLKLWNTTTGACIDAVDTESQISSLHWSPDAKEIVTCHGLPHSNTIVWSSTLQKLGSIQDNGGRIFDSCLSPNGQTLVTAADENLKFYRVFQPRRQEPTAKMTGGIVLR